MDNMRSIQSYIAREFLFWMLPPSVFLYFYLHHFHFPANTVGLHLYGIALLATGVWLIKFVLYRILAPKVARWASSAIYALVILTLLSYYGLVIIGLQSWGQVITEELVLSYGRQAPQFAEIVGVNFSVGISMLCLLYLVFCYVCYCLFPAIPQSLLRNSSPHIRILFNLLLLSLLLFVWFWGRDFVLKADISVKEPFKLSLFSGKGLIFDERAYEVGHNVKLDLQEREESSRYIPDSNAQKRNVILLVVDALRADHLSAYGYQRDTTPNLRSFLDRGEMLKFESAHASCGASACGLASIANSRFPHRVPYEPITLPQILKRYGYKVNMILSGDHTNFYNLREHYGKVDDYYDGSMASGFYMNDDNLVLDKLKSMPAWDGQPIMFQFHLMSAHGLGKRHPPFNVFQPARRYAGKTSGGYVADFTNYYDNGVLQVDSVIRDILDALKQKGYMQDSLVVITADHGEALGEHQKFAHTNSVREELLHIPLLLMNFPESDLLNKASGKFVSQVDIAPTILRALKMPIPTVWEGIPMQQVADQNGKYRDFSYFQMGSDVGLFDHRNVGKTSKYWFNADISEEFLFEINRDPHENANLVWSLAADRREELRQLAKASKIQ